jgi:pyrroline-5-carboxylate reductase
MIEARIHFPGNPWPEGHPVAEFVWTAREENGRVWFDLHLRSADYDAEREIDDDEDSEYDTSWDAPGVWGNYHRCTLSSTAWGGRHGFEACAISEYSPTWLDGRTFEVDRVETDMSEIDDPDELSFHIYLLGHDSVANHRIAFRRRGDSDLFDIEWTGGIALTYAGDDTLAHRFEARIRGVLFPHLATSNASAPAPFTIETSMPHPTASTPMATPVAFIGGGNMARSLIGGLIARGVAPGDIRVSEPVDALREALVRDFGIVATAHNGTAAAGAAVWVLAVKPQVMRKVCEDLAPLAQTEWPLVVSIAAGITAAQVSRWLGGGAAVVRTMPNTPALLGAGVTGLFATDEVGADGRERAAALMASAGKTVWIDDEQKMDAVTATSGSGPAYIFLLAEAMEAAAIAEGLPADAARTLVLETVLGAARMLTESGEDPAELRRRVTSPGGTTQAAVETFEAGGLRALVAQAIRNATERGRQLSAAND